ncbi:MAG TPA: hypothetical protein VFC73_06305 [Syntrophomonadaceae bacterium]|nr:hypothetical protein [Syntrophomonadaceae bacterium]
MLYAIIVFNLLSLVFFYPLMVKKAWRELSGPLLILIIANLYAFQYHLDISIIPNPGNLATKLQPLAKAMARFFQLN